MDDDVDGAIGGEPQAAGAEVPTGPSGARTGPPPALLALFAIAVVVLVVGVIVWAANRGDDTESAPASTPPAATSPTTPSTSSPTTTSPDTTTSTSTSSTSTTTTSSTSSTSTTSTSTSSTTPSTEPPAFEFPAPGADTWTVLLQTGQEVTLGLAATDGDVAVYDGVVDSLRCVAVIGPEDALTSWCGEPNASITFVADRVLEPLTVDLAADVGSVTLTRQPGNWTLATHGCSTPLVTILGAVDPGAYAVTDLICVDDEAFVGIGSSLFGPDLAPDGGGILVGAGDEGWNAIGGFGTSIGCADLPDGVDRCDRFGVEFELFEALLPIPPGDAFGKSSFDVVSLTDRASTVAGWIGAATDPDEIVSIVTAELVDPDAEIPASVRRSGPIGSGRYELLVVEIPQLDDAFLFETWAIWIGLRDPHIGVDDAFSWGTCARGRTGNGLCV